MAYDTRNGGVGATPPFGSGNVTPRNPRADPVTVDPRARPSPQRVAPLTQPRPTSVGDGPPPISIPTGAPDRAIKPLT
jgi:hypothetical protein